jgi:hypothetical protein
MKMKMAALFGIGLLLITGTACVTTPVASPEGKTKPIEQLVQPERKPSYWVHGKPVYHPDFKPAKEGENPWWPETHQWIGKLIVKHPRELIGEIKKQFGPPPHPKEYAQTEVGLHYWKLDQHEYFKKVYKGFDINGWYKQNAI